jgi:hypothetical protein
MLCMISKKAYRSVLSVPTAPITGLSRPNTRYVALAACRYSEVVVVVGRVHAKSATGKSGPKRALVRAAEPVDIGLNPGVSGGQDCCISSMYDTYKLRRENTHK